jgi:hypothetical protein
MPMASASAARLRSPEVARRLGLPGAQVYELIFSGDLDGRPDDDGIVYVTEASVEAYLQANGRGAGQTFGQTNDDKPTRTGSDERPRKGRVTRTKADRAGRRRTGEARS